MPGLCGKLAFGVLLAAVALPRADTAAYAAQIAGQTVDVEPSATRANTSGKVTVQIGLDVFMGDQIRTTRQGEVQLLFTDETKMVIGPNSRLVIESYLLRSNNQANNFTVRALGGTFRMITGNSRKSAYRIKTPTATIGVRGTSFDLAVKRFGETDLILYSGSAQVCTELGCATVDSPCGLLRAHQTRPAWSVEDDDAKARRLADQFPYLLSDDRLQSNFRVATTGCPSELLAKIRNLRAARGPVKEDPDRQTRQASVTEPRSAPTPEPPESPEPPDQSDPPDRPDPPDREPSDREQSGREPTDRGSSGREATDRSSSDRGSSGREATDRGSSDREPASRDPSDRGPSGRGSSGRGSSSGR